MGLKQIKFVGPKATIDAILELVEHLEVMGVGNEVTLVQKGNVGRSLWWSVEYKESERELDFIKLRYNEHAFPNWKGESVMIRRENLL